MTWCQVSEASRVTPFAVYPASPPEVVTTAAPAADPPAAARYMDQPFPLPSRPRPKTVEPPDAAGLTQPPKVTVSVVPMGSGVRSTKSSEPPQAYAPRIFPLVVNVGQPVPEHVPLLPEPEKSSKWEPLYSPTVWLFRW